MNDNEALTIYRQAIKEFEENGISPEDRDWFVSGWVPNVARLVLAEREARESAVRFGVKEQIQQEVKSMSETLSEMLQRKLNLKPQGTKEAKPKGDDFLGDAISGMAEHGCYPPDLVAWVKGLDQEQTPAGRKDQQEQAAAERKARVQSHYQAAMGALMHGTFQERLEAGLEPLPTDENDPVNRRLAYEREKRARESRPRRHLYGVD